ncbi:MAG: DsbA family protein [Methylococcales bacterium]
MVNLYYIHDPMCSWCYAFDAVLQALQSKLPQSIRLIKVLGGLAADSMEPMPPAMVKHIQLNWKEIERSVPHIHFNHAFWANNQAIRSTYPSCRAVLAAKQQAPDVEDKMIAQIQWAYYQNAQNPALDKTLIHCAQRIGLSVEVFLSDYHSELINKQLQQQIDFSRQLTVSSYPSLCMVINKQVWMLNIDYNDENVIIEQIMTLFNGE